MIDAHPDLVGRALLTAESSDEQAVAGLTDLTREEIDALRTMGLDPVEVLIICARLNKKEAILRAFPERLAHSREKEIATALEEIYKIAALRLRDIVQ